MVGSTCRCCTHLEHCLVRLFIHQLTICARRGITGQVLLGVLAGMHVRRVSIVHLLCSTYPNCTCMCRCHHIYFSFIVTPTGSTFTELPPHSTCLTPWPMFIRFFPFFHSGIPQQNKGDTCWLMFSGWNPIKQYHEFTRAPTNKAMNVLQLLI